MGGVMGGGPAWRRRRARIAPPAGWRQRFLWYWLRVDGDSVRMAFTQLDLDDDGPYMIVKTVDQQKKIKEFEDQVYKMRRSCKWL